MECKNHAGIEADYICRVCGKPVCFRCAVEIGQNFYCKECLEQKVENLAINQPVYHRPRKSKLLAFFLGIIPGVGHMYLGLINKGLVIMSTLFAALFLAILFSSEPSMSWFPGFFIPTLSIGFVSYSIFDSLDIADRMNSDDTCYNDSMEFAIIKRKLGEKKKLLGWVLVALGVVVVCNIFIGYIEDIIRTLLGINLSLTNLLLALVLMVSGFLLIRKSDN